MMKNQTLIITKANEFISQLDTLILEFPEECKSSFVDLISNTIPDEKPFVFTDYTKTFDFKYDDLKFRIRAFLSLIPNGKDYLSLFDKYDTIQFNSMKYSGKIENFKYVLSLLIELNNILIAFE